MKNNTGVGRNFGHISVLKENCASIYDLSQHKNSDIFIAL